MEFKTQPLSLPNGAIITKNNFTIYNPNVDFTEERNLFNLTEDLLQIQVDSLNLIIDLGWYGEISTNDGEFKIFVIKDKNWDKPIRIEVSKSQKTINEKLQLILLEICDNVNVK